VIRSVAFILSLFLLGCEQQETNSSLHSAENQSKKTQNLKATQNGRALEDYETARRLLWKSVYSKGGKTLYCGEQFDSQRRRGFNVEHVFPMSWATNGLNCGKRKQCRKTSSVFNRIEGDLHNLYPSRTDVNQDRSSFRFGEVKGEERRYGKRCDFEVNERARVAEPAPSQRGEVARAMFYMAYTYKDQGLELFKRQAILLEKWHRADPPSEEEQRRNDRIEKIQGNRNIFIDQPEQLHRLIQRGEFY